MSHDFLYCKYKITPTKGKEEYDERI